MEILDYFKTISQIPHCSGAADKLSEFLITFAQDRGYEVIVDQKKNILARGGEVKIAFQAHYDMVCVGKAPQLELYEEDGYLKARESSLGADNGMAVAMMMKLMDDRVGGEYLFTSDEEIGLIGASALEFDLKSRYMLNLDSESEAEVYIGCAGGVDVKAQRKYEVEFVEGDFYEINISNLPGGHSGVDIDKNIPNAIKVFASFLKNKEISLAYLKGGERINSIPSTLRAIVHSKQKISSSKEVDVIRKRGRFKVIKVGSEIIEMLYNFQNGVLTFDDALGIPKESANLALIHLKGDTLQLEASLRAMDKKGLKSITKAILKYLERYGYSVSTEGKYPPWKPEMNEFSNIVCEANKEIFGSCEFKAIHAGLESAIISELYPDIKIASIGPTILYPHSQNEMVDLASVDRLFEVVKKVVNKVSDAD